MKNAPMLILIISAFATTPLQATRPLPSLSSVKKSAITLLKYGVFLTPFASSLVLSAWLQKRWNPKSVEMRTIRAQLRPILQYLVLQYLDLIGLAGSYATMHLLNTYFPSEDKKSSSFIDWTGPTRRSDNSFLTKH